MDARIGIATAILAAVAAAAPAAAQDGRYTLERTPNGFVRMDTRTGEMSLCEQRGAELSCRATEPGGGVGDAAALAARVSALEKRIAALEATPQQAMPSDEEFERTLGFMERFMRRFIGVAKDLEKTPPSPEKAPEPAPNRT